MNLAEFLLQRISDEEAAAQAATPGPWEWSGPDDDAWLESLTAVDGLAAPTPKSATRGYRAYVPDQRPADAILKYEHRAAVILATGMHTDGFLDVSAADRTHIARYNPARVLAECESKRLIIELHRPWESVEGEAVLNMSRDVCHVCHSARGNWLMHDDWPCDTLRLLAVPYRDRADFDPSWACGSHE